MIFFFGFFGGSKRFLFPLNLIVIAQLVKPGGSHLHFPMVFLLFSYFPMVFLWFSHGFPTIFNNVSGRPGSDMNQTWNELKLPGSMEGPHRRLTATPRSKVRGYMCLYIYIYIYNVNLGLINPG